MLYFRMMLTMVVSLYTSRIILNTLGIEDFGIYNVVGGFVTMFGFLNSAMASATQRFLAFEIGRNNKIQLRNVFSMSITIHFLIAILILIFAETVGLWFVNTQLTIPAERMIAANWVYQFAILSLIGNMVSVPYNAIIIAHERMNFYAWISIIEVIMKLFIVYMLEWSDYDKLKYYAILMFGVSLINWAIYKAYCNWKFIESKYKFYWNKALFNTLTSFSLWSIWGSLAWVMMGQGLNILLNIFFGPAINAARGIAYQVNGIVVAFVSNFRIAVNPQIIKSYSAQENEDMKKIAIESAKFSFYLLLIIFLPVFIEIELFLGLWLNLVPLNTVLFCKLILVNTMIHTCDVSIIFSAIGKIKENQLWGGLIYILILPISYLFLKMDFPPETVFYVQISATIIVDFGVNIYLLKKIVKINPSEYLKALIFPITKVFMLAVLPPILFTFIMKEGILRLFLVPIISTVSILISVYLVGINKNTQILIIAKITKILNR